MNKKFLFFITLLSILNGCTKKTFVLFDPQKPYMVLPMRNDQPIEILQEPLKEQMVNWNPQSLPAIPVEGVLRVTYKEQDYFYLQMECPQELKCNGKKVYIPRNLTYALEPDNIPFSREYKQPEKNDSNDMLFQKMAFILATKDQAEKILELQRWQLSTDVREGIPALWDPVIWQVGSLRLPELDTIKLYFFASTMLMLLEKDKIDKAELPYLNKTFLNKFPALKQKLEEKLSSEITLASLSKEEKQKEHLEINEQQKEFLKKLKEYTEKYALETWTNEVEKFPFDYPSVRQQVIKFNESIDIPLKKSAIAKKIFESTKFSLKQYIDTNGSQGKPEVIVKEITKVEFDPFKGLNLTVVDNNQQEERIFLDEEYLIAQNHRYGLNFVYKTDTENILFEPQETVTSFDIGTLQGMQNFIQKLPNPTDDELVSLPMDQGLILLAIKTGKFKEYNRQTGLLEYTVDFSQKGVFWKNLKLFKALFNTFDADTYSGEYVKLNGGIRPVRWYQKYNKTNNYAAFFLVYGPTRVYCDRECFQYKTEDHILCFDNNSQLKLEIRPVALYYLRQSLETGKNYIPDFSEEETTEEERRNREDEEITAFENNNEGNENIEEENYDELNIPRSRLLQVKWETKTLTEDKKADRSEEMNSCMYVLGIGETNLIDY